MNVFLLCPICLKYRKEPICNKFSSPLHTQQIKFILKKKNWEQGLKWKKKISHLVPECVLNFAFSWRRNLVGFIDTPEKIRLEKDLFRILTTR